MWGDGGGAGVSEFFNYVLLCGGGGVAVGGGERVSEYFFLLRIQI